MKYDNVSYETSLISFYSVRRVMSLLDPSTHIILIWEFDVLHCRNSNSLQEPESNQKIA